MVAPARRVSWQVLSQIETRAAFSDYVLNSALTGELEPRDCRLVTEIAYGTLRWQSLLDFVLRGVVSGQWKHIDPLVKTLLRMSLYQMWLMQRIPDHALVHDAVELAKDCTRGGADKLVNAVLRRLSNDRPWLREDFERRCPAWDRVSLPRWLWQRWARRYGQEITREYALSLNNPPRAAYRLQTPPGRRLAQDGPEPFEASDLVPGAIFVPKGREAEPCENTRAQDEASQLIPHLLGSIEGKLVWDVCAAPGGKSSILVELAGSAGRVIATDLHYTRARRLKRSLEISCNGGYDVLVLDASREVPFRLPFDVVVVDAPCSGLGTLRRNPEIKWRVGPQNLKSLHEAQSRILEAAARSVRVGGLLLYSTCSTEPEENEAVVASFLASHASYVLVRPVSPPGIDSWTGPDNMVRTFPSTRLWDGFFAALLQRKN
ncbi:MAG: hypothetical protein DMG09_18870 [Acidobacteria bacterium]|nr:MAG: hypothetical protein DMG09_18870 [Acidobacteriota bacterium]